jgi:nitrogenase-associated protein
MTKVIIYQKSDCAGAPRQKTFLSEAGYDIETRDLLAEHWTPAGLRGYFTDRPVIEWFDPQAAKVLSGAVKPENANPQQALVMMMMDPSLIRGPLVKLDGRFASGLDDEELQAFIENRVASRNNAHVTWQMD